MQKYYPLLSENLLTEGQVKKNAGANQSIVNKVRLEEVDVIRLKDGTEINMKAVVRDIEEIRTMITAQDPIFAPYVHELEIVYTWAVDTMATDYSRIYVNPLWTSRLDFDTKAFILYHEMMHCLLDHYNRRKLGNFEKKKWNWAADYEINAILIDINPDFNESIFSGPAGGLYKKEFLNVAAEEIYHKLPSPPSNPDMDKLLKQLKDILNGAGDADGDADGDGEESDADGDGEAGDVQTSNQEKQWSASKMGTPTKEDAILRNEVDKDTGGMPGGVIDPDLGKKIAKAAGLSDQEIADTQKSGEDLNKMSRDLLNREIARGMKGISKGMSGNSLLTILGNYHNSVVNWKSVLKRFVSEILARTKSKWVLPNRRYMAQNPDSIRIRQRQFGNAMKRMIVCMDTSGSMGKDLLQQTVDEINSILRLQNALEIIVLWFDAEVKDPQVLKKGQKAWVPNVVGGGGTDFQVALDFIKNKYKDDLSVCIFFTDGLDAIPKKPSYFDKFIWIIYDNPSWPAGNYVGDNPAFGKVIHVTSANLKKGVSEGAASGYIAMIAESITEYLK